MIDVIYLYRVDDGEAAARNFIDSYRAHTAGADHELHVIFKGFRDRRTLETAKSLFADLSFNSIEMEDGGYDIGSFFHAAKLVSNCRIIFFNAFTSLLADNWLRTFDRALSVREVGVVGATGSWQSLSSYYEVLMRLAFHELSRPLAHLASTLVGGRRHIETQSFTRDARLMRVKRTARIRGLHLLLRPDRYFLRLYQYGRYPNPHLRTNAFMIERARFLALQTKTFERKADAYSFESGRRSMTKQIIAQGLRPVVIGCDGKVYEIDEWGASSTYWAGEQANLIVADNRTRQYQNGDSELRQRLHDYAWVPPSCWTLMVHRSRLQAN